MRRQIPMLSSDAACLIIMWGGDQVAGIMKLWREIGQSFFLFASGLIHSHRVTDWESDLAQLRLRSGSQALEPEGHVSSIPGISPYRRRFWLSGFSPSQSPKMDCVCDVLILQTIGCRWMEPKIFVVKTPQMKALQTSHWLTGWNSAVRKSHEPSFADA